MKLSMHLLGSVTFLVSIDPEFNYASCVEAAS